jgi:hypothetical protein
MKRRDRHGRRRVDNHNTGWVREGLRFREEEKSQGPEAGSESIAPLEVQKCGVISGNQNIHY